MAKPRISIGTWAYLFNQKEPTNDFHVILHKLQDLGYDGVELGSFGPHPSPASHPTKASRRSSRRRSPTTAWRSPASPSTCGRSRRRARRSWTRTRPPT